MSVALALAFGFRFALAGSCSIYLGRIYLYLQPADLTKVAVTEADIIKTQKELSESFTALFPDFASDRVHAMPSIEHSVKFVHGLADGHKVQVLVSGSLHLVGGMIEVAGLSDVALRAI